MTICTARLFLVAVTLSATLALPGSSFARGLGCKGVADDYLCVPLPHGWFGAIGPGVASGRPAAYLLAANFYLPSDAGLNEATPAVPARKVLISIGDFPLIGQARHWRHVQRLRLPHAGASKLVDPATGLLVDRVIAWHVRFAGRALWLSVHFGSTAPTVQSRALANARLNAVRRIRR